MDLCFLQSLISCVTRIWILVADSRFWICVKLCRLCSANTRFIIGLCILLYSFNYLNNNQGKGQLMISLTLMRYLVISLPAMSKRRVRWGSENPSNTGQMWVTPSPESTTTPVCKPVQIKQRFEEKKKKINKLYSIFWNDRSRH